MATTPIDIGPKLDVDDMLRVLNKMNDEISFPVNFRFGGHEFVCLHDVFLPENAGHDGFIEHLPVNQEKTSVLEIGSGTGVIICGLYLKHRDLISNIVVTDISPQAVLNTRMNFEKHDIPGKIHLGDLFEPLSDSEKFDLIFWDPPFSLVSADRELSFLERSFADPGYKGIERFLSEYGNYLSARGRCFLGFSPEFGEYDLLCRLAEKHNKKLELFWSGHSVYQPLQSKVTFQLIEIKDH